MAQIPVIAIVGPTASGKSELAVRIAKKYGGEIISADSRQIYRGLDIASGKVRGQWRRYRDQRNPKRIIRGYYYKGIRHHLIDEANPQRNYTVATFQGRAKKIIREMRKRGAIPIVVGGTGFWVDTVIYDSALPRVAPNEPLRQRLAKKSPEELCNVLKELDPIRARSVDRKNPRRLIRAIEIARALGRVPRLPRRVSPYRVLWIGIDVPAQELKKRIRKRVSDWMARGLIAEARRLHAGGLPWRRFRELGSEYHLLGEYLRGTISRKALAENIERTDRRYAGKQLAWFRKNKEIHWVSGKKAPEKLAESFLEKRSSSPEKAEHRSKPSGKEI